MTSAASPGAAVVVLGAGAGSRVGAGRNKVLLPVAGTPLLARSVVTALGLPGVGPVLVVVHPEEERAVADALQPHLRPEQAIGVVVGGTTRHASEWAALRALAPQVESGQVDVVAIHDGARPLAAPVLFAEVLAAARRHGGAIPVVPATGLLTSGGAAAPAGLAGVQTPQAFRADALLAAYRRAAEDGFEGTDTAACLERYRPDLRIAAVGSSPLNLKVTFAEDVAVAAALLDR